MPRLKIINPVIGFKVVDSTYNLFPGYGHHHILNLETALRIQGDESTRWLILPVRKDDMDVNVISFVGTRDQKR